MATYGLKPETDALMTAIRATIANNDMSAQTLAVAVSKHLAAAGWSIVRMEPQQSTPSAPQSDAAS